MFILNIVELIIVFCFEVLPVGFRLTADPDWNHACWKEMMEECNKTKISNCVLRIDFVPVLFIVFTCFTNDQWKNLDLISPHLP